jgi:hypothetical protein
VDNEILCRVINSSNPFKLVSPNAKLRCKSIRRNAPLNAIASQTSFATLDKSCSWSKLKLIKSYSNGERSLLTTDYSLHTMEKQSVIAIFDVGKTNKKLFLFDEQYKIVFERSAKFNETVDEDGDPCENLDSLRLSVFDSLREVSV